MEKEFLKYEQALVLKELGFNKPCLLEIVGGDTAYIAGNDEEYIDYIMKDYKFPKTEQPMYLREELPVKKNPLYEVKVPLYQQVFEFSEKNIIY